MLVPPPLDVVPCPGRHTSLFVDAGAERIAESPNPPRDPLCAVGLVGLGDPAQGDRFGITLTRLNGQPRRGAQPPFKSGDYELASPACDKELGSNRCGGKLLWCQQGVR